MPFGQSALQAGYRVTLPEVDAFCDGTAVKQAGELAFTLCQRVLDEVITVSNAEVCTAIERLWEWRRLLCEPSGALGLAGLLQESPRLHGKGAIVVITGSNIDLTQVTQVTKISGRAAQSATKTHEPIESTVRLL